MLERALNVEVLRTFARDVGERAFNAYRDVVRVVLNLVARVREGATVARDLVRVFDRIDELKRVKLLSPSTFFLRC